MRVDVVLADHAAVHADKLFVTGGGINRMSFPAGAPGPYAVSFAVAGTVTVEWGETEMTHELRFVLLDEDGGTPALGGGAQAGPDGIGGVMSFSVGRGPQVAAGEAQQVPFAFQVVGLPLAAAGRYVVALSLDGVEVRRVPFAVAEAPAPDGAAGFGPASIPGL